MPSPLVMRRRASSGGTAHTISLVGSVTAPFGGSPTGGVATFNVTPEAVGDVIVLGITGNAGSVTAVSGGSVSTWTISALYNDTTHNGLTAIAWGEVTGTVGSAVSTSVTTTQAAITVLEGEFSVSGIASPTWSVDVESTAGDPLVHTTDANLPLQSVTASGSGELYLASVQTTYNNLTGGASSPVLGYAPGRSGFYYALNVSGTIAATVTSTASTGDYYDSGVVLLKVA